MGGGYERRGIDRRLCADTFCRMKTTMEIPDELLRDAMRFTKAKTRREAIVIAVGDFNQRQRMAELTKFSGTCREMMSVPELLELREERKKSK